MGQTMEALSSPSVRYTSRAIPKTVKAELKRFMHQSETKFLQSIVDLWRLRDPFSLNSTVRVHACGNVPTLTHPFYLQESRGMGLERERRGGWVSCLCSELWSPWRRVCSTPSLPAVAAAPPAGTRTRQSCAQTGTCPSVCTQTRTRALPNTNIYLRFTALENLVNNVNDESPRLAGNIVWLPH